eukprot:684434-Pelagomonas_calceolata.AAC.2
MTKEILQLSCPRRQSLQVGGKRNFLGKPDKFASCLIFSLLSRATHQHMQSKRPGNQTGKGIA